MRACACRRSLLDPTSARARARATASEEARHDLVAQPGRAESWLVSLDSSFPSFCFHVLFSSLAKSLAPGLRPVFEMASWDWIFAAPNKLETLPIYSQPVPAPQSAG